MDLHGLAQSREDGTPAVPHMVLSDEDAKALQQHYQHNGPIPYLGNDDLDSHTLFYYFITCILLHSHPYHNQ